MIWDIFKPLSGVSNPAKPGQYLGSVTTSDTLENGVNADVARLDLHLRKTGRKAYGETYGLVSNRRPYNWRGNK